MKTIVSMPDQGATFINQPSEKDKKARIDFTATYFKFYSASMTVTRPRPMSQREFGRFMGVSQTTVSTRVRLGSLLISKEIKELRQSGMTDVEIAEVYGLNEYAMRMLEFFADNCVHRCNKRGE